MSTRIHPDLQWQLDSGRSQLFQIQVCLTSDAPDYDYSQISGLDVFQRGGSMLRCRASREAITALEALPHVTAIEKPGPHWE